MGCCNMCGNGCCKANGACCGCAHNGCEKAGYEYAKISVPVKLTPNACVGKIEMICTGEPAFCQKGGSCGGECELVITQNVCIKVPIRYSVSADLGEAEIVCNPPKSRFE